MSLRAAAILVLLAAPCAFAQVDLGVSFEPPPERARTGDGLSFLLTLRNHSLHAAAEDVLVQIDAPGNVSVRGPGHGFTCSVDGNVISCTSKRFEPTYNTHLFMIVGIAARSEPGPVRVAAAITSATPDPNPNNDFTTAVTTVVAQPDLFVSTGRIDRPLDPSGRGPFGFSAINFSPTPAENVRLTANVSDGATTVSYSGNAPCTIAGSTIVCDVGTLAPNESASIDITFEAPPRLTGGTFRLTVEATSSNPDFNAADNRKEVVANLYRWLVVANTHDEGAGSLRQALLDGAGCNGFCKVAFRIPAPVPESGWFTIRPRSPLPPVIGNIFIDGATQTALTGDTNAEGPEIEIDGALAGAADGITIAGGCEVIVSRVAIGGFDGHGIEIRVPDPCVNFSSNLHGVNVLSSYIGTDPGGRAVPNRRGIVVGGNAIATIRGNTISGNERAGLFVQSAFHVGISSNEIVGNGASGVYVHSAPADIDGNTIARNGEWGVGRSAGAVEVSVTRNSIFDNGVLGIDIGLDFETPPVENDAAFPNPPELLSAIYDPATNTTTIRGRVESLPPDRGARIIELFASRAGNRSGRVEGERPLIQLPHSFERRQEFTAEVKEDLTGQFITATNTRFRVTGFAKPLSHRFALPNTTSEFSNAVQVTR